MISDSLASVRFGSELRVEFNERRVEAVTSSMCDFEFRTPQASHGYCQQSYEHLKEAEVGMPKARVPDRDEQHTRVCEVWGPRRIRWPAIGCRQTSFLPARQTCPNIDHIATTSRKHRHEVVRRHPYSAHNEDERRMQGPPMKVWWLWSVDGWISGRVGKRMSIV